MQKLLPLRIEKIFQCCSISGTPLQNTLLVMARALVKAEHLNMGMLSHLPNHSG